ncbi:MAG: NlpC/P60 family protein [Armatimonas sp.]
MARRYLISGIVVALLVAGGASAQNGKSGTPPKLIFPVEGAADWSDTYGAARSGGRKHEGQDLMAPKMRHLVACFDGVVTLHKNHGTAGHWITLKSESGWRAEYMHLNNDTPGTDDGKATDKYIFAPGLKTGDKVKAGQFLGFVGDSGNAEEAGSHCHFELHSPGGVVNAAVALAGSGRRNPVQLASRHSVPRSLGSNTAANRAAKIVALAYTFLGGKYRFGGSSPGSGFDCSGLVEYVYSHNGIELPRTAAEQFTRGKAVRFEELAPGDLIFQAGTYKKGISHVGIYIGNGKMLHAKGEQWGIVIDNIAPWKPGAPGARRVIPGLASPQVASGAKVVPNTSGNSVAFLDPPTEALSGSVRLKVGYDPHPVAPGTEYAIEVDDTEAVAFAEAGVYVRFDTTLLEDGEHTVRLVRRNQRAGTRYVADTILVTTANTGAEK